ncbi:MAG: hypothetical protein N2C14_07030, partial [Planctomycetales bacterium]
LAAARASVVKALDRLHELLRLFFSVVELLRSTTRRQAELNDQTEQAAALAKPEDDAAKIGPLAARQEELQEIASQIAAALEQQSRQPPPGPSGDPRQQAQDAQQQQQAQDAQQRFAQAAKLTAEGESNMKVASAALSEAPPNTTPARESQDHALQKLLEALALLVPPK